MCAYTGACRTFNRWSLVIVGVTPQLGGYPSVKGFVCPCAHHHQWLWRSSSPGKTAFFLFHLQSGTIIPRPSPSPLSAVMPKTTLVARIPATFRDTGTILSLIKISFREVPSLLPHFSSRPWSTALSKASLLRETQVACRQQKDDAYFGEMFLFFFLRREIFDIIKIDLTRTDSKLVYW